ncbi:MAG: hypothetical protein ACRESY_02545 [Steroidobacteraceae bacterium]
MLQCSLAVQVLGVSPWSAPALAWGDEGHEFVALIGAHCLPTRVWTEHYRDSDRVASGRNAGRGRRAPALARCRSCTILAGAGPS